MGRMESKKNGGDMQRSVEVLKWTSSGEREGDLD